MNQKLVVTGVIALIVGLGVGYGGATAFASKTSARTAGRESAYFRMASGTASFAGRAGGAATVGTVASVGSGTLTLTTGGGSSKVVVLDSSTQVEKTVTGSVGDLSAGANVVIEGTSNSDGSLTASLIQIRPAGMRGAQTQNAPMIPASGTAGQ